VGLESEFGQLFLTSRLTDLIQWSRKNSLWPYPFGTACCAIELMATLASRYDLARFGMEVIRFSPRQSDVLIVAGRVPIKLMPVLQRIYQQMPEPKWVVSMGACASTGGEFDNYAVVQGVDRFIPVDVYVPGCPPRPETLITGLQMLQKRISGERAETGLPARSSSAEPEPLPSA
jgi:NADH-quinone oxidoreductase subunit B